MASVGFRPEGPDDADVIRNAHVANRRSMLAPAGLPPELLERLCVQQHDLQERHIAVHHPSADRRVIVAAGRPVGRLCIDRTSSPWRLVDVAISEAEQGSGWGTAALRALLVEAAGQEAEIDLHVALDNRGAEALYRRLGFVDAGDDGGTHRRMLASPRSAAPAEDQLKTAW